ncbi:MAG: ABC transporter substrate-binding protein [Candidatus Limivivens sp.]|nr:ABC transporter substrate-binding protein [Candidatus Limivivens sp.]
MKKRVLSLVLAGILSVTTLAGSTVVLAEEEHEPVTLRFMWWGGDERNEATVEVINMFEEKYPWITIEPEFSGSDGYQEKLSTALAGGQAADVIQNGPGWMPEFVSKGDFFIDFNEYTDIMDLNGFDEEYLKNTGYYNDKQVGLPSGIAVQTLLVNKTLADEIGLEFTEDLSWDDLIEMGKKVQEYDSNLYLLNLDSSILITHVFRPYYMQLSGKPFIDDETKAMSGDEEILKTVLSYIESLYTNHVTQPAGDSATFKGSTQTNPKWINGEFVCAFTNSSQIDIMTSANPDTEYEVVALPHVADAKDDGFYANPPQLMCVNKDSEHVEEAVMFLDFFFNDKEAAAVLRDLRSVPPTSYAREVCEEQNLISDLVNKAVEYGLSQNGTNEMGLTTDSEVEACINTMIESIMYGESTVEESAADGISTLDFILSEK